MFSRLCSTTKDRPGRQAPSFTAPRQECPSKSHFYEHLTLENSSSHLSVVEQPLYKVPATRNENRSHSIPAGRSLKVFVPPFKSQSHFHSDEQHVSSSPNLDENTDGHGTSVSESNADDSDVRQPNEDGSSSPSETVISAKWEEPPLGIV